jgi:hypothetical protein
MPLTAGARLGAYEISEQIGAGGMGHVYRARDTRLERDVALKVLPDSVAADTGRLARFEQEARATAALNHPNIVAAYDVGAHEGRPYLVSELLEGKTLSDALHDGVLPMRKALDYTAQIAAGLAAAHDKGIVHRDLKPANVFITTDGRAKILDFGIAKLVAPQERQAMETVAPKTHEGMVLGTAGYMSPEQIRAAVVDHRTDIFSLGVIVYEMLSGRHPFAASTDADVMSAVLTRDPATLAVPDAAAPGAIDRVVRRCLEKLPEHRFQSARDLGFALEAITADTAVRVSTPQALPAPAATSPWPWRERAAWALVALLLAATATLFLRPAPSAPLPQVGRFDVQFPPAIDAVVVPQLAVAPDGSAIALNGPTGIYIRQLNGASFVPIVNTDSARSIAWTPDSKGVVFVSRLELRLIQVGSSESRLLARLPASADVPPPQASYAATTGAMAFSADGTLLMSVPESPLHVLRRDGALEPLGTLDTSAGERAQAVPVFLPDGRRFFYRSLRGAGIVTRLGSIDGGERQDVTGLDGQVVWAGERHVLVRKENALLAQEISYAPLALKGAPTQVFGDVRGSITGNASIAVAPSVLTYQANQQLLQQFTWVSRDGASSVAVGPAGLYYTFSLSDDGSRVVVTRREPNGLNLWVMDAEKGTLSPATVGSSNDVDPRFSPDGRFVVFGSNRDPKNSPHRVALASPDPQRVYAFPGRRFALDDWSADGAWLLYHDSGDPGLSAVRLDRPTETPISIVKPLSGIVDQATMSPDGRWVAYNSSESGRDEVYVVPFPPTGDRWQVSVHGGAQPLWRRDSGELYFLSLDGMMMAATIRRGDVFHAAEPVRLFKAPVRTVNPEVDQYAAAPDGKRFLFAPISAEAMPSITVVTNWSSLLGRSKGQ